MRYRALVGIKRTQTSKQTNKAERDAIHVELMKTLLKKWDSTVKVQPYYDPFTDPDKLYEHILKHAEAFRKNGYNVDRPIDVLNALENKNGKVFYARIPQGDKRMRENRKRKYEQDVKDARAQHRKMPNAEDYDFEMPAQAPRTKLYPYSVANPDGQFVRYSYPIVHSFHSELDDVNASKLVNRNYGTYQDILQLCDLDFEATFLPNVVFLADEMFESYPDYDDVNPGGDPDEIQSFLMSNLDRDDYIAIIECETN